MNFVSCIKIWALNKGLFGGPGALLQEVVAGSTDGLDMSQPQANPQASAPGRPPGKVFKKCKSATFQIDGATYTIVASPPGAGGAGVGAVTGERRISVNKDDSSSQTPVARTRVQLAKQGSLTIVRRSSSSGRRSPGGGSRPGTRQSPPAESATEEEDLEVPVDVVDLAADNLPAVDTPDACDKAAFRLRGLLRQLQSGEVSAEVLQRNLQYAARVLEAVFIDETRTRRRPQQEDNNESQPHQSPETQQTQQRTQQQQQQQQQQTVASAGSASGQRRRLRTPVWARVTLGKDLSIRSSVNRRLADEDDELSEVQPDAVPPEVREWLASTFTRQLATTRRKSDEKPKFRSVAHAIRAGIFVDRMYRRVGHAALMQFPSEVARVLKNLDDWSFDVFSLNEASVGQPVKYIGYDLLNRYGMIHKFKVPPPVLEAFLVRVEEGYCRYGNPYHNNLHAADVSQTVHYMLCQTGLMNWMTDLEIFATLIAALIHDFDHTGTTNNFHVMSGSDTALLYNDRAVLENHHLSAAFKLMKDDECNVAQNLSRDEFREFRTLVIDMVLATDMSFHFQQLKNMRNLLSLAECSVDKSKALSLVLHTCDIAHPSKRWNLHRRWTGLLLEEFFRQGDMERDLGLPFSPLCDRNNTLVAESQIGFIEFIVEPSMGVCGDMLEAILAPPEDANATTGTAPAAPEVKILKPWVECLAENKSIWKEQATKDAELRAQQQQQKDEDAERLEVPVEE